MPGGIDRRLCAGPVFFFALFFSVLSLGSCAADSVLGIDRREAAERLKRGDTAFLLAAAPEASRADLEKFAKIHPSAPYYGALVLEAAGLSGPAQTLFETGLNSPNALVRKAAAFELFGLHFRGANLPGPVLDRLRREAPEIWDKTLGLLAGPAAKEPVLAVFFSPENRLPAGTVPYMLGEAKKAEAGFFSPAEEAAVAGYLAVSRSSFAEGLSLFRQVLEEDRGLFFRYPRLLDDLGRCFQYTATGNEGVETFLAWEEELAESAGPDGGPGQENGVRFRLLFFSGRIARQRGRIDTAAEFFARALPFAPDTRQEDACIWYLLDAALQAGPESAAALTAAYMPRWNDGAYFADILDRLSRELTMARNWGGLVFLLGEMRRPGLKSDNGPAIAKYACIIGLAAARGLYVPSGGEGPAGVKQAGAEDFFRLAVNTAGAPRYYQALGAFMLGTALEELPPRPRPERQNSAGNRELMEFLRGFFDYGAAAFALPAIVSREAEISTAGLRSLAEAMGAAGRYPESFRLVSLYMERPGYVFNRVDAQLYYPRPFQAIIEQAAREAGLRRELLFALVRTESAFQPAIVSQAGAVGLTQLMPATAADMAARIRNRGGPDYTGAPELRDPAVNVHIGTSYLRYLMDRLESPILAILAYNGGMNRVRRWRSGEPELPAELFPETVPYAETREYIRKVLSAALIYGDLYYGLKIGPFFSDIFKNEGLSQN